MIIVGEKDEAGENGKGMESAPRGGMKKVLILGFLSALFIAAAFTAGRLLGEDPMVGGSQETKFIVSQEGDQAVGMGVMLEQDARLPDEEPAAQGPLHHREDNSLFISQFPVTGVVHLDSVDEWPVVEVLVTKDTLVYKDVTDFSGSPGGGSLQQKVAPGSIEEIGQGNTLIVWGELRGERLVADVLQYFRN
ncbi:MAG: hypothetical protein GTO14_05125 [Anaerolineales bacterium]|nr:hypothetical protein [Anaerolineales bacterium]